MTHAELADLIRREIIVEQTEDAYTDADIFEVTKLVAGEMAVILDFPRVIATDLVVAVDSGEITAPANCLRVHSLIIDGLDAQPRGLSEVLALRYGGPGMVRAFNFDPRRGNTIQIAPVAAAAGTATAEYTRPLAIPANASVAAWEGMLPEWHWLIAYRSALRLMDMTERTLDNPLWEARYREGIEALAATWQVPPSTLDLLRQLGAQTGGAR